VKPAALDFRHSLARTCPDSTKNVKIKTGKNKRANLLKNNYSRLSIQRDTRNNSAKVVPKPLKNSLKRGKSWAQTI
jgi:hypothetical protein